MKWLRQRMTYANVMSTLAVFIALGGSSYAAVRISGRNIQNHSITAQKIKRNSLTGRQIRESRLGRVPHAATADRVGELTAAELKEHCPADTVGIANVCVERAPRPAEPYGSAVMTCLFGTGTQQSSGRRLPTHSELMDALTLTSLSLAPGGELTADVVPSGTVAGKVDDIVMVDENGGVTLAPDVAAGSRQFRCVTDPLNGPS
jgi:hypothetical protein